MADKIYISNITITTSNNSKVLTKKQIAKFCSEKVKISVKKTQATTTKIQPTKCNKKLQLVEKKVVPKKGEFVFAKVRGYCEWPAIVTKIEGPNHVCVDFFNSTEM